jgi:hypothetical protein
MVFLIGISSAVIFLFVIAPIIGQEKVRIVFDRSEDLNRLFRDLNSALDMNVSLSTGPVCGNSICENGETVSNCLQDCFVCNSNGTCENELGENENSCPIDCPNKSAAGSGSGGGGGSSGSGDSTNPSGNQTSPFCGNGTCDTNETTANCPADCLVSACMEGSTRSCSVSNSFGSCFGTEQCQNNSWVNCTASTPVAETCDGTDNDCDGVVDEGCSGTGFFGMGVLSVVQNGSSFTVTTTGARYVISGTGMELWRRIDPATNSENPRRVAVISFDSPLSSLVVESVDTKQVVVGSDQVTIVFNSDSFFVVQAKQSFSYTYTNLVSNALWNKGSGLNRMWTDGYGGSLHAKMTGNPIPSNQTTGSTRFSLVAGDSIGQMVFPPKLFDFERLYGIGARPFVHVFYSPDDLTNMMSGATVNDYMNDGFGVFLLWPSVHYENMPGKIGEVPILLPSGIMGYKIRDSVKPLLQQFVSFAHSRGFKVITYMSAPVLSWWKYPVGHPQAGQLQDVQVALQWMRDFQVENDFDGWYFDNADTGELAQDYSFIRQVRTDIGDRGVIYHHDSVDVWDSYLAYTGLKGVMLDAYVDYTVTGETGSIAETDAPTDSYFRFFVSGYGLSQAFGSNIRVTSARAAVSTKEMYRVLGQNLNAVQWNRSGGWSNYFKPFYDQRKVSYQSGNFSPAAGWPIDSQIGWFRVPVNVQVTSVTGTSFRISWETNSPSDSEVAYTSNGSWWFNPYHETHPELLSGPDGVVSDPVMVTSHSVLVSGLNSNTAYEFRIRSSNRIDIANEIIWGYIGSFTTGIADADGDGMSDDWELQYFGTLARNGTGDFDGDGLLDLQEFNAGTNPNNQDSDFDGFLDGVEVANGTNPLDWGSHSSAPCNNNGICENHGGGEDSGNCPADCDSDLVGFWGFKHCNAWDQSGNNRNGVVVGAVCQATGGRDGFGSFSFRGGVAGSDYIRFDSSLSNLSLYGGTNGSSTVVVWVKPVTVNKDNVVTHHLGGFDYFSAGSPSSAGRLVSMVWNAGDNSNDWPTSAGVIGAGEWHSVAFVFRGGVGWEYYIDGSLAGQLSDSALVLHDYSDASDGHSAYIGFGWPDEPGHFEGLIDDVSLWKKALPASKICSLAGKNWTGSSCT